MSNNQNLTPQINRLLKQETKEDYLCPISFSLMKDPVIIESGQTFDRKNIQTWFQENNSCPITRKKCNKARIVSNNFARKAINKYKEKFVKESLKTLKRHLENGTCLKFCGVLFEKGFALVEEDKDAKELAKMWIQYCVRLEGSDRNGVVEKMNLLEEKIQEMEEEEVPCKEVVISLYYYGVEWICLAREDLGGSSASTSTMDGNEVMKMDEMKMKMVKRFVGLKEIQAEEKLKWLMRIIDLHEKNLGCLTHYFLFQMEGLVNEKMKKRRNKKYEVFFLGILEKFLPLQSHLFGVSSEMLNRYITLAKLYRKLGKVDKAKECYTKAIDSRSEVMEQSSYYRKRLSVVYNNRGILQKDTEMEMQDLSESIKLFPSAKKFCNRGVCYEQIMKHREALNDYCRSIELDRSYTRAISLKRDLLLRMK